jgi:hypothetical protein
MFSEAVTLTFTLEDQQGLVAASDIVPVLIDTTVSPSESVALLDSTLDTDSGIAVGSTFHLSTYTLVEARAALKALCNLRGMPPFASCGSAFGLTLFRNPDAESEYVGIGTGTRCAPTPSCFLDLCGLLVSPDGNPQVTQDFSLWDFVKESATNRTYALLDEHLVEQVQTIRDAVGNKLKLASGFRAPAYQKKVCGDSPAEQCAKVSQHMLGGAADLQYVPSAAEASNEARAYSAQCMLPLAAGAGAGACVAEWRGKRPHLHIDNRPAGCGWTCPGEPVLKDSVKAEPELSEKAICAHSDESGTWLCNPRTKLCGDRYCGSSEPTTGQFQTADSSGLSAADDLCAEACEDPDAHICNLHDDEPTWITDAVSVQSEGWVTFTSEDDATTRSVWGCNGVCDDTQATAGTAFTSNLLRCSDSEDDNGGSTFGAAGGPEERACNQALPIICCN